MNTQLPHNDGSTLGDAGNWIAFLFGATFNLLGKIDLLFVLDYLLQAFVGGLICLAFKIIGDILSPLWERHKAKVKDYVNERKGKGFLRLKRHRKSRPKKTDSLNDAHL